MTGPLAASLPSSSGAADAVAVAAVAQLAVELVDEVAAVGEDQHAAGARGLDEPERGDRLAGAGRVLEPEAAVGVGVLRGLVELDVLVELVALVLPVLGLLVLVVAVGVVELGLLLAGDRRRRELTGGGRRRRRRRRCRCRCAAPRRAARSACPTARRPGGPRARCRRRGAAPPRTAAARARAAARSAAATRSRACPRPRRARPARRRAPGGAPSRARARPRATRPRRRSARA